MDRAQIVDISVRGPITLAEHDMPVIAARLAGRDPQLARILASYGPPPLWRRPATYATLVRIILEQQVSLSSAKAVNDRLRLRCGGQVTAAKVSRLGAAALAEIGFSRQKIRYALTLADNVRSRRLVIGSLTRLDDDQVRRRITAQLGLGDWSASVFLMMALCRGDVVPLGDLAMVKGLEEIDQTTYDDPQRLLQRVQAWRPYRSVGVRMVWQNYLALRGQVFVA